MTKVILYNNKIVTYLNADGDVRPLVYNDTSPEPIVLPVNTLRFRFSQSNTNPSSIQNGGTWTKVEDSLFNDWDWTCDDTDWSSKFSNQLTENLDPNIKIIAAGDTSNVTNMVTMFGGCTSLTTVPLFDTSNVTSMSRMFAYCNSLTTVPLFDTGNVTSMAYMFYRCTKVESGALALYQQASATGKVDIYSNAFTNCGIDTETGLSELQQIPQSWGGLKVALPANTFRFQWEKPIDNPPTDTWGKFTLTQVDDRTWDYTVQDEYLDFGGIFIEKFNDLDNKVRLIAVGDISGFTNMHSMFAYCTSLTTVTLFDTSNVTNMFQMFDGCTSLTTVTLFDTSNVTITEGMFRNCNSLTTVTLFDTNNVTDMSEMFYNCTSLTAVPLFDTSNVTNMDKMFYNCTSLTTVPLFDTNNVTDMSSMFNGCTSLTTVPLFDTNNVTNMVTMFAYCNSLTTVPLFNTSNVTNMIAMFYGCIKVVSGALALYQQASAAGKVTSHTDTFKDCGKDTETGLVELQQIPTSWGGLA